MKRLTTLTFLLITFVAFAQKSLSLEDCYTLVKENYPLAKQANFLEKQNAFDLEVINTENLPKFNFSAQATYQSDVIEIPISLPGTTIEAPNKDQYKATLSVNQLIYDGGLIKASKELKINELKTQQKQLEVTLYQLNNRVNQIYFSILLIQDNKKLLNAKKTQLENKLQEVKAGIKYGVLLPASDKILEAELLKIEQQFIEIDLTKTSLVETLSTLIGIEVSKEITLENPEIVSNLNTNINRPEIDLFQLQKKQIEASEELISKKNTPKLMGFATGGYGNPGLNMLDNSFQAFYQAGIQLNWNPFDWNATKKQKKSLQINKDIIENQQEIFELNTNIELNQQEAEIEKFSALIESDKTIIELRKKVLKSVSSQLKNGVITSSVYITELTNLYEAEKNLSTHKIEMLFAKAIYKTTQGN